ncbi:tetratricopeptide repeat protein [Patescibacteria group bacterium]
MDLEKLLYIAEEKMPQIKTLILGLFVVLGAIVALDSIVVDFANFVGFKIRPFLYPILLILWIGYWAFNKFHLPRNKKDKVGIVIAIYSENEAERQKLKADFISKLKKDLQQEGILSFSEVIFLKNHFSNQIKDSDNPRTKLETINKKIKAHFYVWGDVKKRPDGDEGEKYFINFQGYVVHKSISQNLSQVISVDFSKVLPKEVNFLEKRSFKGFEASATIVHLAAKYIIGIAAFVSQDPQLALKLHNGLKDQFNAFRPLPPHLQDIRNRIPLLISDEMLWIAKWHFENNRIDEMKSFLEKSLSENNNNYGAWLFKAIVDFMVDKNIDEALKSVKKAEQYAKNTFEWRYSKAFLYFWKEDYQNALKLCQKIKQQSYLTEQITLEEVRKFNLNLLSDTNPKTQLYFWIGFLSYFKRNNLEDALQDFENFDRLASSNMNLLKQKSDPYLREIKQKMGIR